MPRLSVCLITKNESRDLTRCLTSVRGLADEIVVVDTGSTDDTIAIAQAHGARVLHHAWRNDFADARNVSLDAATGDWVLVLDADDEVPTETAAQIPGLLAGAERARPPIDGLTMLYHSPMPAGEAVAFTEYPVLRLFRNRPEFRFRQAIHEQVLPAILAGIGLGFARAIGEFGSVVLISGNIPFETEVAAVRIYSQVENDNITAASAIAVVLLAISLTVLLIISVFERRSRKHDQ